MTAHPSAPAASVFPADWLEHVRTLTDPNPLEGPANEPMSDLWWQERNRRHARDRTPPRFANAQTDLLEVYRWVQHLLTDRRTVPSLLLAGPTGTGKTHTAFAALRLACESRCSGLEWRYASTATFFGDQRPKPGEPTDTEGAYQGYATAPVLLLDDLGATKRSEWTEETLYRLIDHRYTHCLPSIFTTNVTPDEMSARLGSRIASRLAESCRLIVLDDADRRYLMGQPL